MTALAMMLSLIFPFVHVSLHVNYWRQAHIFSPLEHFKTKIPHGIASSNRFLEDKELPLPILPGIWKCLRVRRYAEHADVITEDANDHR